MAPITVLIADDQAIVRRGFRAVIDDAEDMHVVGEAADGDQAITLAAEHAPDVVLMDVRMPGLDGIDSTRHILAHATTPPQVLVVTTFDLDEYVFSSLRAGASGFMLKDADPDDLLAAIRILHRGDCLLSPSVTRRLIAEFVNPTHPQADPVTSDDPGRRPPVPRPRGPEPDLSTREQEIVMQIARGLSNAEIAAELYLAETTIKTHVSNVLAKWGARDRVQLVIRAFELGLTGNHGNGT